MQVQIKPALRQVWRGPATVQIGLDPRYAMVLDGLTAADRRLLEQLRHGPGRPGDPSRGPEPAARPGRDELLLRLLGEGGVLVRGRPDRPTLARFGGAGARLAPDAATWSVVHGADAGDGWDLMAARARRCVEVVGGGRTGAAIATTLACAGIGVVQLDDDTLVTDGDVSPASVPAAAIGTTRRDAVRAAIAGLLRRPPGARPAAPEPSGAPPDAVVLIEHGAADALAAQRLVATDVTHLSVVIREGTVVVGPLVVPGSTPCLRCLDLHRADRDPAWPRILAQVIAERRAPGAAALPAAAEETASSLLGAALAALQVLAHLDALHLDAHPDALPPDALPPDAHPDDHPDDRHPEPPRPEPPHPGLGSRRPAAAGATLEVELPDGLVSRRDWPAHPACGCHWPPRDEQPVEQPVDQDGPWAAAPPGQDAQDRARAATMAQ